MKKYKKTVAVIGIIMLCLFPSVRAEAAEELYVAGMPDAWPLEYYDSSSNTYQGVLPDMMQAACEKAGITLRYLDPSSEDRRLALARNVQVDLMATLGLTEQELSDAGLREGILIAAYTEDGTTYRACLAYTKSISPDTVKKLEQALEELESATIQGMYLGHIQAMEKKNIQVDNNKAAYMVSFGILIVLLVVMSMGYVRKKKTAEEIAYLDNVTGGGNFAAWKRTLAEYVVDGNREHYAILFIQGGIDTISHIYGYREAYSALKIFSDVCTKWIRPDREAFCRFNEYYFIFFVQYQEDGELKERINTLYQDLNRIFEEEKKRYFLDLYTGIYQLKSVDKDPLQAIQFSEVAGEYARTHFMNAVLYSELVEKETISDYAMEHEAIHGLIHQEFLIYMQPIIDIKERSICGAEALARWQNPRRGLLSPGEFLEVMKKKQLIGKMNLEIYRQGCRFLQKQQSEGRELYMLFNFTVENIGDEKFPMMLKDMAQLYDLEPERIIIQLNQPSETKEAQLFAQTVKNLREYGFHVWMSALELDSMFFRLLDSGVNGIKLGSELVRHADQQNGGMVLENVIDLCHKLNLIVLCVGAENREQVKVLEHLDCEYVSGLYFYYPMTGEAFDSLLSESEE